MPTSAYPDSGIEQLLHSENELLPPKSLVDNARLKDYAGEYKRSIEDPEAFWADAAKELEWFQPWTKVFEWKYPTFEWFQGGKFNITHNCLDRQVKSGRKNKVAYIWVGEDGTERQVTYGQLLDLVGRTANALKSLGVKKGDRVIVYMPLCLEGIVSMLACARIGAVHSVVYAGFSVGALRSRIEDAQARVILTADVTYRRGKAVPLRAIVQESIEGLDLVEKVVVLRRVKPMIELTEREVDFNELVQAQKAECLAEVMDAEDPLYILYTSGTTGKPKGVVHVHGGYAVGIHYHMTRFWDIRDDDVFFCTSDIGWVVGHSYIVYAPLLAGVTTLFREGAIDYPNPGIAWELVEKYRVSVAFTAPTAVRMFMRHGDELPKKYDLRSIRLFTCAGEPLNPEALQWAYRVLCGNGTTAFVADNWWQTETGGPCLGTLPIMAARAAEGYYHDYLSPLPMPEKKLCDELAIAAQAHAECGGPGVGAVGMCFTGGFALAMMVDQTVVAPVLSQPSLPFPVTKRHKADLGISDADLAMVKARVAQGVCVMGLRFTGDPYCFSERFETLRRELGNGFIAVELDSSPGNPYGHPRNAHSVLTEHLDDREGTPTRAALDQVLDFFRERLHLS